jgi:hypothetical protein
VKALSGAFSLDAFGAHNIDRQRRGLTVAVDDVAGDPRNEAATWEAIETRAFVSVPLVREGQVLSASSSPPRVKHHSRSSQMRMRDSVFWVQTQRFLQ